MAINVEVLLLTGIPRDLNALGRDDKQPFLPSAHEL